MPTDLSQNSPLPPHIFLDRYCAGFLVILDESAVVFKRDTSPLLPNMHLFLFLNHKTHSFQMISPANYDNNCLIAWSDYTIIIFHVHCIIKTNNYMKQT